MREKERERVRRTGTSEKGEKGKKKMLGKQHVQQPMVLRNY